MRISKLSRVLVVAFAFAFLFSCAIGGRTVIGNAGNASVIVGVDTKNLTDLLKSISDKLPGVTQSNNGDKVVVTEETIESLKKIAADESQSVETRENAKKALDIINSARK